MSFLATIEMDLLPAPCSIPWEAVEMLTKIQGIRASAESDLIGVDVALGRRKAPFCRLSNLPTPFALLRGDRPSSREDQAQVLLPKRPGIRTFVLTLLSSYPLMEIGNTRGQKFTY